MVEIKYCPECQKAKREHLFKTSLCPFCGSETTTVETKRSRYFFFMMPFLLMGAILHLYTVYRLVAGGDQPDPSVTLGLILLGIGMYIIAIGFQVLDSKQMEKDASEHGMARGKGPKKAGLAAEGLHRPKAGSGVRVKGPKKKLGKPRPEEETPSEEAAQDEAKPEPPKKDIPIRRPKEKAQPKEGSDKEEADREVAGAKKAGKQSPAKPKKPRSEHAQKKSPPKARKILTR